MKNAYAIAVPPFFYDSDFSNGLLDEQDGARRLTNYLPIQ
jgi:hypothetical protein